MNKNFVPLKSAHCYAILDRSGFVDVADNRISGIYLRDTRHLSSYKIQFEDCEILEEEIGSDFLVQYYSRFKNHYQEILVKREFSLKPSGFTEILTFYNDTANQQLLDLRIDLASDFVDIFVPRGIETQKERNNVFSHVGESQLLVSSCEASGACLKTMVSISGSTITTLESCSSGVHRFQIRLKANSESEIKLRADFTNSLFTEVDQRPSLNWVIPHKQGALSQAYTDIETLLLPTDNGFSIAAGLPNFCCVFGRDSLITAWFLLKAAPELAKGVLRFLAHHQGKVHDEFRDEQPGKILHEFREGELSRNGFLPFHPYFGTADATPLFIKVVEDYCKVTGDFSLAIELQDSLWRAADWVLSAVTSNDLVLYRAATDGKGLQVKSWKDSGDSMSYSNGKLATGDLTIVEVQGYAIEALGSMSRIAKLIDVPEKPEWSEVANRLEEKLNSNFWMEKHQTFALGLDAAGQQLDVVTSDPGHLLWSGVLGSERAHLVASRMMQDDLFSGWGVRTLSTNSARYNPLSYHNGSIWPHDTGIFAAGLHRYGFKNEFDTIAGAILSLAETQKDLRLPELVGGYGRQSGIPPLAYTESCRPQAWSSAALIYLDDPH